MSADVPPASSLKLPAPFGKYLLTQLIAVGGMAEVYRAKIFGAQGFEKEMVVKRILPKYAQNPSFVQMLIDEAKIAVSLSHGNIVPIYELGELEGSYYIAMEFVEGRTVLDVLRDAHSKRVPLSWAHCCGVAAEVCKGLAYAHGRSDGNSGRPLGLVHRDINPRNIVITRGGEVKILDFGIARASTKRHQTASGVIKGTPGYMSPEQMYGQSIDHRTDLYCVGIMVFELLTLRRLFPVWDVAEMRMVFEAGPVPPPSTLNPALPKDVDAVVMKALATKANERWQTAAEFEEALRTVIAKSGIAVTSSGLAREVQAIDDAPGARAPRTSPAAASLDAKTHEERPSTKPLASPSSSTPAAAPSPTASAQPTPRTQPMPMPTAPAAAPNSDQSFVISLADEKKAPPPQQLAPLPSTSAKDMSTPRTQVLAQNNAIGWAGNIGEDAEMIAIARAMGSAPGQGKRTLAIAAAVGLVLAVVVGVAAGPEIAATVKRALSDQQQVVGTVVVKVRPAPEEVTLDGKSRGGGNKKIANVDVGEPHRLVVKPKGLEPIVVELTKADFVLGDDGSPTYLFERDFSPKPPDDALQLPTTPPTTP
jgi:serine/threonine protein kinase